MHSTVKDWTTAAGFRAVVLLCEYVATEDHKWHTGYVGITKSHPLFGVAYNEQAPGISQEDVRSQTLGKKSPMLLVTACVNSDGEGLIRRSPDILFDVHGGLTYSAGNPDYPIVLLDHEPLWWFGFDCHHLDDTIEVQDANYTAAECERLAQQLKDFAKTNKK